jgi:hypothetical protein
MNLVALPEVELRALGKREIESLEQWLRGLVDGQLTQAYGPDYLHATRDDGSTIVKSKTVKSVLKKQEREPSRFPRAIDATFLEELIEIVCNPVLFKAHFAEPLTGAFPLGHEMARIVLDRLVEPRNRLSHTQSVSVRSIEQVVCYSHDVIDAIQRFYAMKNAERQFNVPEVLRCVDSLGNTVHRAQFLRTFNYPNLVNLKPPNYVPLHVGQPLWIEVDVDSSFTATDYDITWSIGLLQTISTNRRVMIELSEEHVGVDFTLNCRVTSHQKWHRHKTYDDAVTLVYTVLPPN